MTVCLSPPVKSVDKFIEKGFVQEPFNQHRCLCVAMSASVFVRAVRGTPARLGARWDTSSSIVPLLSSTLGSSSNSNSSAWHAAVGGAAAAAALAAAGWTAQPNSWWSNAAATHAEGAATSAPAASASTGKGWVDPEARKAAAAVKAAAVTPADSADESDETILVNWSGTHSASTPIFHEPETVTELERVIAECHAVGARVRVVGSAISPNGIGLSTEGMVSIACCDRILEVDKASCSFWGRSLHRGMPWLSCLLA
jgi:hypothetical protein